MRADKSITVLSIKGTDVKVIDTIPMGEEVTHVVFTPDGKRALATESAANKVALLEVAGDKVTYTKRDFPTGLYPYNVAVAPNAIIALTADNGNGGTSDGNVDRVGVIDLSAEPPRVIDHITVPDGPEGLGISPKGNVAATIVARGSNKNTKEFFYHPHGASAATRILVNAMEASTVRRLICVTGLGAGDSRGHGATFLIPSLKEVHRKNREIRIRNRKFGSGLVQIDFRMTFGTHNDDRIDMAADDCEHDN